MATLATTYTHLHESTNRILRVFPIVIAATLFCSCSDDSGKKSEQETCTQDKCENWCGDFKTDKDHCGNCETQCKYGEYCNGGTCASTETCTQDKCENWCGDFKTDKDHCGNCETQCKYGEYCNGGTCASTETCTQDKCEGWCGDFKTDKDHCGNCETQCGNDEECITGNCVPMVSCEEGEIKCYCLANNGAADCTDTYRKDSSPICINPLAGDSCGAKSCTDFGKQCPIGWTCNKTDDEQYECECAEGLVTNSNTCLDPYSSQYCGVTQETMSSDLSCDSNELCSGTECQCAQGLEKCGGDACVDVLSDNKNCGKCGNECDKYATCQNGTCVCNDGFSRCDVDGCAENKRCEYSNRPEHCGAKGLANDPNENSDNWWGKICDENNICELIDNTYQCICPEDFLILDEKCTIPWTSIQHCGATKDYNGIDCRVNGYETNCFGGSCVCSGGLTFVAIYEDNGVQKYIDLPNEIKEASNKAGVHYDCIDTKYDSHCCGAICKKCEENHVCTGSQCVSECRDGFLNCNGVCLDKSKYKVTGDGENSCKCRSGYCPINGDPNKGCPDELNSDNHCGECGKKCPATMTCTAAGECICQVDYYDSCTFEIDSYNHNAKREDLCIQYRIEDSDANPLADLHIVREKNCSAPGSQGYSCENDGTKVCHKCAEHWANLDGDWSNGCETDLSVNVTNCGVIGNNCYEKLNKAASIACVDNRCVYTVCNDADYLDCNDDSNAETTPDGCEANVKTDVNHCGRCGNLCLSNKCVDGVCCYSDNLNITQDPVQFTCCSGNQLYRYAHQPVVCPEPSHYGCASTKPEGDCWSAK